MKYLDAKKRLLFISSALKYIKLVMTNNPTITMDEVKMFVKEAIPIAFGGEISNKDKVEIINSIKTYLLKGKSESYFQGSLGFDLKSLTYINGNENSEFDSAVKTILAKPEKMNIKSKANFIALGNLNNTNKGNLIAINKKIKFYDDINIFVSHFENMKSFENIKFLDTVEFKNIISNRFKISENINFNEAFEVKLKKGLGLDINNKITFKDSFTPAPKDFVYTESNESLKFIDKANILYKSSNWFEVYSKTAIDNFYKINVDEGKKIKVNTQFSFLSIIEFKNSYSALCHATERLLTKNNVKLSDIKTFLLELNSNTKFSSQMMIDIEHIITLPIQGQAISEFSSILTFDFLKGTSSRIESQIKFKDASKVRPDKSDIINSNNEHMFDNEFILGTYRYAFLKDIEDIDMNDYLNSTIDSIIYLKN